VFVDASAIVAILTDEAEAEELAATLDSARESMTSPIAVWEAAVSIARKTGRRAEAELPDVRAFLDLAEVRIMPVDMVVTVAAIGAFDRYGRRSGHPADLNMGDCFAYAFAKERNIPLLYKGKDFVLTDVRQA
jgi:ribonuclease VapC